MSEKDLARWLKKDIKGPACPNRMHKLGTTGEGSSSGQMAFPDKLHLSES